MMKKWLSAAVCSMMFAGPAAFTLAHAAPAGSKADYDAAVKAASANYKAARAQCDSLKDNAKDVCVKEAKRDEDVAKANAEATRDGTAKARAKADKVKADADYSVAKEKCDDAKGNDKDVCVKEAKLAHERALGSAKVEKAAATGTSTDVAEHDRPFGGLPRLALRRRRRRRRRHVAVVVAVPPGSTKSAASDASCFGSTRIGSLLPSGLPSLHESSHFS